MSEAEIVKVYNQGINSVITLVQDMNNTMAEMRKKIDGLTQEVADLRRDNQLTTTKISELEEKFNKNSSNSSKPPSTDGYNKKPANSRTKTGRPAGGQQGHEGSTLLKVENPDEIIDIRPGTCECGCDLSHIEGVVKDRQEFDIPEITVTVKEFRTHELECPNCHKIHKTEFPKAITQPVQYGENLQALIAYLTSYQFIPLERAAEMVEELFGQNISEGTIVNINNRLYTQLEDAEKSTKEQIINSDVAHFDESGLRVGGKTMWVHSASTDRLTHYAVESKRGAVATNAIGILPKFKGTAVHDHWRPYYTFTDCTHAECNAHHLRTLKGIYENYNQEWARDMAGLLVEIKRDVDTLKEQGVAFMPDEQIKSYTLIYTNVIAKGKEEDAEKSAGLGTTKTGKPKKSPARRLLEKFEKFDIETLSFMYDFSIPFDNNLAERDLRMVKLRQKVSGTFHSKETANGFCRIRGYISTCRKNGQGILSSIKKALRGEAFIPQPT